MDINGTMAMLANNIAITYKIVQFKGGNKI